nr:hypothetical protein [uncultured Aminipila sp.]
MKKKFTICGIIIVMLIILGYFWWNMPVYFAKGINAAEVRELKILDENAERAVVLTPSGEMNYILDSLSDIQFKKSGISVGHMDYGLEITIIGNDGKVVSKFNINSDNVIGEGLFLYEAQSISTCYDYLESLF